MKQALSAVVRDPPFCMEPPAWPLRQNHQPWCNPAKETTKIPLVLYVFFFFLKYFNTCKVREDWLMFTPVKTTSGHPNEQTTF